MKDVKMCSKIWHTWMSVRVLFFNWFSNWFNKGYEKGEFCTLHVVTTCHQILFHVSWIRWQMKSEILLNIPLNLKKILIKSSFLLLTNLLIVDLYKMRPKYFSESLCSSCSTACWRVGTLTASPSTKRNLSESASASFLSVMWLCCSSWWEVSRLWRL